MNLNQKPSVEQLSALLGACDDEASHHVLWVDKAAAVRVSPSPAVFGEQPGRQFCYESYAAGNGYVGPIAAADTAYVAKLLDRLVRHWRDRRTGLVDD